MRNEVERYQLLLQEYDSLKLSYHQLYLRYAEVIADNDRLARQE